MAGTNGWAALGQMLGGQVGQAGAYEEGQMTGHKLELAMQQARRERANALIDTVRADNFQQLPTMGEELGISPAEARLMAAGGGNAQQLMAARGTALGDGYRQQAADAATRRYGADNPNAPLFGLADGPLALGDVKGDMAIADRYADRGGGMTVTPLGEASIRQRNASAASSYATANNANVRSSIAQAQHGAQMSGAWDPSGAGTGTSGPRGQKAPSGYRWTADGALQAIPGGPADKSSGGNDPSSNLNPRQQVAVQGVQRNLVQYAAALLGKEPEEMAGLTAAQIAEEIRKNGGRTVQGGTARLLSRLPGGTTLGELNNVDILSYSQGAGAAWAAYENPTGIITNADRETATSQMPTYLDPPEVQARKIRSFLELSGYQPQGRALGDSPPRPAARAPAAPAAAPARVANAAQYNALPSGATYIAPDGTQRRKP